MKPQARFGVFSTGKIALFVLALAVVAATVRAQTDESPGNSPEAYGAYGTEGTGDLGDESGMGDVGAGLPDETQPSRMAGVMERLGITPEEAAELQNELASGQLSQQQMEDLCARFASRNLTPAQINSYARAMGLDPRLQAKFQACATAGRRQRLGKEVLPTPAMRPRALRTPEPPSPIERDFQQLDESGMARVPTPRKLKQFGYSLFASRVSTFAPVGNVPVGDDYVVGPGDQLNVILWGRINRILRLKVERDGTILVPEVGPVEVSGLTFPQARNVIEGRVGQIMGVRVDVTMGRLRTIQVFVVGEVKEPGVYTVSALSHVSNVLAAAGGISKVGSLRDVQLRRQNQLVRKVDLYQILMYGNTADDLRLEPQDVVFVPVAGPVVGVVGDVKRPAIYELTRKSEDLGRALRLAGGINAFGYSDRIQVERIENHERRIALDLKLDALASRSFEVRDGDLIKVFPVLSEQRNVVMLRGNVNRPGSYEWKPGMRVSDLIRNGEGVGDSTFLQYALIRRMEGPEKRVHLVRVDLASALRDGSSEADAVLRPQDELTIFSKTEMHDSPTVRISGEVRRPGRYPLNSGMKVSDLVNLAGGPKGDAYLEDAEVARTQVIDGAKTLHRTMNVDLRAALNESDHQNLELEPYDEVFVRRAPGWHLPWKVVVKGEVLRPGPYSIHEGERVRSVLMRCGGFLPDAYPVGAVFIRKTVQQAEQKELAESKARLEQNLARLQLYTVQTHSGTAPNVTPGETATALKFLESILEQSKNIQAQGRVVVHIKSLQRLAGSGDDIVLEDGDEIVIPRRPSSVNVLGQVYGPTAIVYDRSLTVRDYLARAGGPNELADAENTMVVQADGSILTDQGMKNSGKGFMFPLLPRISGGLMSARLEPGDTVYVPEKLFYTDNLEIAKDVATILGQAALGFGTVALVGGL